MEPGTDPVLEEFTALRIAIETGQYDDVAALLERGVDVNARADGTAPLHTAAQAGQESMVQLLLKKGAEVIITDIDGRTPLHRAAQEEHEEVVRLLAQQNGGACLEIKDVYGLTPLHLSVRTAQWRGPSSHAVIDVLAQAGANPDSVSRSGKRAVQEAADYGDTSLVELLQKYGAAAPVQPTLLEQLRTFDEDGVPLDIAWTPISTALSRMFWSQTQTVDVKTFMSIYDAVTKYCLYQPKRKPSAPNNPPTFHRGANLLGKDLYRQLDKFLQVQVAEIGACVAQQEKGGLLPLYRHQWGRFQRVQTFIQKTFSYLERHYIRRGIIEGEPDVHELGWLCLLRWKVDILRIEDRIVPAVLELVDSHRAGHAVDTALAKDVVESLIATGADRWADPRFFDLDQGSYDESLLETTIAHYRAALSYPWLKMSIAKYMQQAEDDLKDSAKLLSERATNQEKLTVKYARQFEAMVREIVGTSAAVAEGQPRRETQTAVLDDLFQMHVELLRDRIRKDKSLSKALQEARDSVARSLKRDGAFTLSSSTG